MPATDGHGHRGGHDLARYTDLAWRDDGGSRLLSQSDAAERQVAPMDANVVADVRQVQVPWCRERIRGCAGSRREPRCGRSAGIRAQQGNSR